MILNPRTDKINGEVSVSVDQIHKRKEKIFRRIATNRGKISLCRLDNREAYHTCRWNVFNVVHLQCFSNFRPRPAKIRQKCR